MEKIVGDKLLLLSSLIVLEKGAAELRTNISKMREVLVSDFNDVSKGLIEASVLYSMCVKNMKAMGEGNVADTLGLSTEVITWGRKKPPNPNPSSLED